MLCTKKVLYKCQTNKMKTKEIATFHDETFTGGLFYTESLYMSILKKYSMMD